MKKLLLLLVAASVFAGEGDAQYLCQNINYQIVDGSVNGQPLFMKMTFTQDSYDQDVQIELFDKFQNPNTDEGLKRNCHDHFTMSQKRRSIICLDDDVFSSTEARAFVSFKVDSFSRELKPTFLGEFYDTDFSSNQYNFRLRDDSKRQFYCKKIEAK